MGAKMKTPKTREANTNPPPMSHVSQAFPSTPLSNECIPIYIYKHIFILHTILYNFDLPPAQ
jgi:hypothetical protein